MARIEDIEADILKAEAYLQKPSAPKPMTLERRREILDRLAAERGGRQPQTTKITDTEKSAKRERAKQLLEQRRGQSPSGPVDVTALLYGSAATSDAPPTPSTNPSMLGLTPSRSGGKGPSRRRLPTNPQPSHKPPEKEKSVKRPPWSSRPTSAPIGGRRVQSKQSAQQQPPLRRRGSLQESEERQRTLERLTKRVEKVDPEAVKREREEAALALCTFHPAVASSTPHRLTATERDARTRRLHNDALLRSYEHRVAMFDRVLSEEAKINTHRPEIDTSKVIDNATWRPLHQRLGEVQLAREQHQRDLEKAAKEAQAAMYPFRPLINPLEADTISPAEVTERLLHKGEEAIEKQFKLRDEIERQLATRYTFKPRVNPNTDYLLQHSQRFQEAGGDDFLTRQKVFQSHQKDRLDSVRKAQEEAMTFTPMTNQASIALATNPNETFLERMERLAVRDREEREDLQAAIAAQHLSQFSFHPKIDPLSKEFGPSSDIGNPNGERQMRRMRVIEEAKAAREEAIQRECTFEPQLSEAAERTRPHYDFTERGAEGVLETIRKDELERRELRERMKNEAVMRSMDECTFQPQRNLSAPAKGTPLKDVKGVGRYMELKKKAKLLKEEKAARERKVFGVSAGAMDARPFRFNYDDLHDAPGAKHRETEREMARQREREARQKAELTFAPKTSVSEGKARVAALLKGKRK